MRNYSGTRYRLVLRFLFRIYRNFVRVLLVGLTNGKLFLETGDAYSYSYIRRVPQVRNSRKILGTLQVHPYRTVSMMRRLSKENNRATKGLKAKLKTDGGGSGGGPVGNVDGSVEGGKGDGVVPWSIVITDDTDVVHSVDVPHLVDRW